MKHLAALALLALAPALDARQGTTVFVDLGSTSFPTNGTVPATWNDLDDVSDGSTVALNDATGAPSGVTWTFSGTKFSGTNSAGTSSPTGALAEFPVAATRDTMWGQSGAKVEVTLAGFPANSLVSLTFAASRTGVSDVRTTDYAATGFNSELVTLNASNNTSETARIRDVLPNASGEVVLLIEAASSNTNQGTHFFYLNALRIDVVPTVGTPQILAFDSPKVEVALDPGTGSFDLELSVLESTGASPSISLSAVDDATGFAPTWMTIPATTSVGTPFTVTVDDTGLPVGTVTATLTASAAGYDDEEIPVLLTVDDSGGLNLLFYGNSYSIGNFGMPSLAGFIAEEAGEPSPNVVTKLVGGQNLFFHLTDPGQAAAITDSLPLGQLWDFVVMQGFSLEATSQYGDPAAFRANALAILTNVRAHSPNAKAVMFQTWARGEEFGGYPGTYVDPYEMHLDIRTNYRLAVADMNSAFGPGTAFNAAIGDAVALLAFDQVLYDPDQSHPTQPTTLMAGMGMYQAIWRARTCDVDPDFAGSSNLIGRLGQLGLGESDWIAYGGIAERIADPELRRFAGSGEDLLLATGLNGSLDSCPTKLAGNGDTFDAVLTSPNGLYTGLPAYLVLDPFLTGNTPGTADPWPELHFHLPTSFLVSTTPALGTSLTHMGSVPGSFPGVSVLLQGLVLGASSETGNTVFTTTDAHELVLQ